MAAVRRATALAPVLAMAAFTPSAFADPPDPEPITLVPDTTQSPGGGPSASLAVPQRYLCGNSGTLRNVPDGFVMGWCRSGWPIDLERASANGYQGWAYGNYDGCGWIYATHIGSAQPGYTHSCLQSTPESAFMQKKNLSPSQDGAGVDVKAGGCRAFLNVRPWNGGPVNDEVDPIAENSRVYWRYLSRDGGYVMLRRDTGYPYTWGGCPANCV